jgi:energy-coupling factor transport system substrate-specific component
LDDPSNNGLNQPKIESWKLSLIAILTASAIATNYLMIGALNVKLMDLIVFTSGYILGPWLGALTGGLVWLVYGTLNPYGFSLPVFASTVIGEALFGIAGGFFSHKESTTKIGFDPWAAITGFLLTFIYDLFTNIVAGATAGVPILIALITGTPFTLAHMISNTVFFGFGFKHLVNSINKVMVKTK